MKALTLWRPWARYVATGEKRIENRPWAPPPAMLGQTFAIHAGRAWDDEGGETCRDVLQSAYSSSIDLHPEGIIGTARLVGWCDEGGTIIRQIGEPKLEGNDRLFLFGPIGWILRDARLLAQPIPCRGFQKLWNVKPPQLELLSMALAA